MNEHAFADKRTKCPSETGGNHAYAVIAGQLRCLLCGHVYAPDVETKTMTIPSVEQINKANACPHHQFSTSGSLAVCKHCGLSYSDWVREHSGQPIKEVKETVDHPLHYGGEGNPFETIKVLTAWLTPEQMSGFVLGNAIKYLSRADKKGSIEDLRKAQWYLDYEIKRRLAAIKPPQ